MHKLLKVCLKIIENMSKSKVKMKSKEKERNIKKNKEN